MTPPFIRDALGAAALGRGRFRRLALGRLALPALMAVALGAASLGAASLGEASPGEASPGAFAGPATGAGSGRDDDESFRIAARPLQIGAQPLQIAARPRQIAARPAGAPASGRASTAIVLWGRGTLLDRDKSAVGFGDLRGMRDDLAGLFLAWRSFTGNLPERYSGLASSGMLGKGLGFFLVFGAFLLARGRLADFLERLKARGVGSPGGGSPGGAVAIAAAPKALFLAALLLVFLIFGLERKHLLAAAALIGGAALYGAALVLVRDFIIRSGTARTGTEGRLAGILRLLVRQILRTCAWTLIPIAVLASLSYKPGVIDLLWVFFRVGLAASFLSVLSRIAAVFLPRTPDRETPAPEAEVKEALAIHALRLLSVSTLTALYAFSSLGYNNLTQYLLVGIFFSAFVVSVGWFALSRAQAYLREAFSPGAEAARPALLTPAQRAGLEKYSLRLLRGLFYAGTLVFLLVLWGVDLYAVSWTFRVLGAPLATLGGIPLSLGSLIKVAAIFFLFLWLSRYLRGLIQRRLGRTAAADAVRSNLSIGVGYLTVALGIILALKSIGVDFTTLTVLAGVLGIGIGFGLQNISNNLISGIILLLERTVKPGDFIEVGDTTGEVQRVTLRSTVVRTLDNISVIVPNSNFVSGNVVNWSHGEKITRGQIDVGVAYGSDTALIERCLLEAARSIPDIIEEPPPRVFFAEFGESSLDFHLLFWCDEPKTMRAIKSALHFKVDAILRDRGITIPFPQRDVHMIPPKSEPPE